MADETTLWKGSPSQWLNFWRYLGALIFAGGIGAAAVLIPFPPAWFGLVLPLAYMLWRYLKLRTEAFELTTERLRITRGVLNQRIEEIELYRVKESVIVRPWWMRLTGLGSILMETSDRSLPQLTIPAVRGGAELREQLRKQVELIRDLKRVREMDFEEHVAGDTEPTDAEFT